MVRAIIQRPRRSGGASGIGDVSGERLPEPDLPQDVPPRGPDDEGTQGDPQPDEEADPEGGRAH